MARQIPKQPEKQVALIYTRVSTARQASDGIGLDAQEAQCRAYAERKGWPVLGVFRDEGVSGKEGVEHRQGLARLLKEARANPNAVVIVYSISRLSRQRLYLLHLLDTKIGEGLPVASVTEEFDTSTPMGRAMIGMLAVFYHLEGDLISERTKDALAEARAQGKKLGQRPNTVLAPEAVKLVKELYATGRYSQRQIAEEMNNRGIPNPRGTGKWYLDTVQRALKAPIS